MIILAECEAGCHYFGMSLSRFDGTPDSCVTVIGGPYGMNTGRRQFGQEFQKNVISIMMEKEFHVRKVARNLRRDPIET